MSKPVIFDDGGSIRIRALVDNVAMDDLIGNNAKFRSTSHQQFFNGKAGNSEHDACLLLVTSIAEDGSLTKYNAVPLDIKSQVLITTTDKQTVTVAFDNQSGELNVELSNTASGLGKNNRRRYVMDSGLIDTVAYTIGGKTTTINLNSDATNLATLTIVHFVDHPPKHFALRIEEKSHRI